MGPRGADIGAPPPLATRERPIHALALFLLFALLIRGTVPAVVGAAVLAADRGRPARLDRRAAAVVAREACARALFAAMRPLSLLSAAPPRSRAETVPVLLVAAPPVHRAALWFLKTFLVHRGHTAVWAVGLPRTDTLDAQAVALGHRIEAFLGATGRTQVDLVAHGDAGLAAAWFVRHLDGRDRVRRLVTLGTPWRGTRMAVFRRGSLAPSLLPGAPVLDDLSPPATATIAIGSPDDPMVVPSRSAFPDGAQGIEIDGAGHTDLLVSARAFRAVRQALSAEAPSP